MLEEDDVEQEEPKAAPETEGGQEARPDAEKADELAESPEIVLEREAQADGEEHVQKRMKRASRKELLEHLQKKNTQLMELDRTAKEAVQQLKIKEDRMLRIAADFENFRKRTHREWELLQKRANADLIKEIIGGIDNFDRAIAALEGMDEAHREGLRLIRAGFMEILGRAGVTEMAALGAKFDPKYHEAVGEIDDDTLEDGCVAQVVRKGYLLHGEALRPARVMISRKKS